jgi:hypothetical protein
LTKIKAYLPSNVGKWNQDILIGLLESKIKDIEDLEQKLLISKQNLGSMITAINSKPDEIACEENANRLLNLYYANDKC